jgi:predicted acetyltransferase
MTLEIRTITDDEITAFRSSMVQTFGDDADSDPAGPDRTRALLDLSQIWAAVDAGSIVATAGTFNLAIGVPGGGTLPMAGLTMVSVRPTHRRRGILRELMRRHLDDARQRGYAISGLWASEASIYGRFDYGIAAESDSLEIEDANTLAVAPGRELDAIEWTEEPRAREALPAIYARATADRPGALRRSEVWWRERRFLEAAFVRDGASKRRHVIARRGDDAVGYIAYRQRGSFTEGRPSGKTEIIELIGIDARAEATLWRFALGMDLFPTVTWWNAPTDDVLAWIASDPRRIKRRRTDNLWLRIEDVAATLAARRYAADGALRFAIDMSTSWELVVEDGRGRCTPTPRSPDLRLARSTLGAVFLGGIAPSRLARAELVQGDVAAIATADRLFASAVAPWCPEIF